ncbi:MAG: hypothetical protein RIR69_136 [Actinomycetota bacterium]
MWAVTPETPFPSVACQYAECVNELICLDMPCGQEIVDRIQKAWENGDAVFPLNQQAPLPLKKQLIEAARPTRIVTLDNETSHEGQPVETGDGVVIATSGTSGEPKCVVLTLDALTASAVASHRRLGIDAEDAWLCCLPPSHVGGFGVIARSLLTSTRLIVQDGFSVDGYNTAADNGATCVSLVATALKRVDPQRYTTILLGGSRPPTDLPANCTTTYGMTESGGGVIYNGVALDGVEIDVREGIIHLRSAMLMRTFRDGTSPIDSDGWLYTGDAGFIDAQGKLFVEGRVGDLIITGGENVWPDQVEQAINSHPSVAESCVASLPDPEWGHIVSAWIVLNVGATLTLDDVRHHVKQTLPAYCAPRQIHIVGAIPRTSLGKAQRHLLQREQIQK